MYKIAHFFVQSGNMGDLGSSQGIKTILRAIEPKIAFTDYPIRKKKISYFEIKHINSHFDAIVIGGGGLFYSRKAYSSKWYLNIALNDYRRIVIPKCIWGVGLNREYSDKERWHLDDDTVIAINDFIRLTDLVGVRDLMTVNFIQKMDRSVQLTPCPSMFLLKDVQKMRKNKNSVAINLTDRSVDSCRLYNTITTVINHLRKLAFEPVFVTHVLNEDEKWIDKFKELEIESFVPSSPENLMEFYKNQEFIIGMRGHSLIFATGANIPMIALSYNKKCDEHMSLLGLDDYLVKYDDIYNADLMIKKIGLLLTNQKQIKTSIQKKYLDFWDNNYQFGRMFINLFRGNDR